MKVLVVVGGGGVVVVVVVVADFAAGDAAVVVDDVAVAPSGRRASPAEDCRSELSLRSSSQTGAQCLRKREREKIADRNCCFALQVKQVLNA